MIITIGWWAVPFAITVFALAWAFIPERADYYGIDVVGIFKVVGAVIISLVAWLIWALVA